MKKYILTIIIVFVCVVQSFSQGKPLKFGFEVEAIPFKMDNFSEQHLFSLSGYIGFFSEISISDQFTTKFSAGLNNIYFRKYASIADPSYLNKSEKKGDFINTLELKVEPRFYLFSNAKSWGNCYAALPISFETAPLSGISKGNLKIRIIPTIGYRYILTKNWMIEANTGLGWGKTLQKQTSSALEYSLQARIGYTF